MPEGPELFLSGQYINTTCNGITFTGKVEKSEISKNPEVPFESDGYLITAASRGKELKLTLTPISGEKASPSKEPAGTSQDRVGSRLPMDLVFRLGMSGNFQLAPVTEIPKHAHLCFYTRGSPPRVLCYVDVRRFGKWEVDGTWQAARGPCVMLEYERFRENVLRNLSDKAFDKPICEALLNQKFFNGIGNYLRAEILYRAKVPPFEKARTVLDNLQHGMQTSGQTLSRKIKLKRKNPDLLELCHLLPMEVVNLGGQGYNPNRLGNTAAFEDWLSCYSCPSMKSLRDANGRTIWFQGVPGPMTPKGGKLQKKKLCVKFNPDAPSPKMARRNSKINPAEEKAERRRNPRRDSRITQERPGDSRIKRASTPKTRVRRTSALQEPSPPTSPAQARKRQMPIRKKQAKTAAVTGSRRVKTP